MATGRKLFGDLPGMADREKVLRERVKNLSEARLMRWVEEQTGHLPTNRRLAEQLALTSLASDLPAFLDQVELDNTEEPEPGKTAPQSESKKTDTKPEVTVVKKAQPAQDKEDKPKPSKQIRQLSAEIERLEAELKALRDEKFKSAPLPFPIAIESAEETDGFGLAIMARIKTNRRDFINSNISPLIRHVLDDTGYQIGRIAHVKMHGLQQEILSLGVLMVYAALQQLSEEERVGLGPESRERSSPELRMEALAQALFSKLTAGQ
jgi:hypothetical protein